MKKQAALFLLAFCMAFSLCGPDSRAQAGLDYSGHTDPNEAWYVTILADPAALADGGRSFATQVPQADWRWREFDGLVQNENGEYDVRGIDLSEVDLGVVTDDNDWFFSTSTLWPESLPEGFDPAALLEFNQNPGLGIRALHREGITGSGVGIAIIDQALLLEHEQYQENLMYYELIHSSDLEASLHGPAVASIAVGKDIGVAPGAKLYYIARTHGHDTQDGYAFDASILADCIDRVLEINRYLPEDEKIRVISISRGYGPQDQGYDALNEAIARADRENIFVITTSPQYAYDFQLFGMNRDYRGDPDDFEAYYPVGWVEEMFYANPEAFADDILFPIGSRTYAACTGASDYELAREGGLSWAVPWCAGFYALCCEVKPDLTPEAFISLVRETAVTTEITHEGKTYAFGKIVNPAAVIERLQSPAG